MSTILHSPGTSTAITIKYYPTSFEPKSIEWTSFGQKSIEWTSFGQKSIEWTSFGQKSNVLILPPNQAPFFSTDGNFNYSANWWKHDWFGQITFQSTDVYHQCVGQTMFGQMTLDQLTFSQMPCPKYDKSPTMNCFFRFASDVSKSFEVWAWASRCQWNKNISFVFVSDGGA